jgi:hypothetical protein
MHSLICVQRERDASPLAAKLVGPGLRSCGHQDAISVVGFLAVQPIPRSAALLSPRSQQQDFFKRRERLD